MKECKIKNLYNLDETIASKIFEGATYPWEVLPKIEEFIKELGNTLSSEEYEKRGEDIWIAKTATIAPTAYIKGPAIIGKNAEYIRAGLRLQRFDFGSAVPPKKEGGNWNYNIIKSKFYKYAGINERKYYTKKCDLPHKIR